MKKKSNGHSKKLYTGLKRVNTKTGRKWSYGGKLFDSLSQVHIHYVKTVLHRKDKEKKEAPTA